MLFGMWARQVKKFARLMARLARKKEKLARFWHIDTLAGTLRCHVNHSGTHFRMTLDLGNSREIYINPRHRISNFSNHRKGMGKPKEFPNYEFVNILGVKCMESLKYGKIESHITDKT